MRLQMGKGRRETHCVCVCVCAMGAEGGQHRELARLNGWGPPTIHYPQQATQRPHAPLLKTKLRPWVHVAPATLIGPRLGEHSRGNPCSCTRLGGSHAHSPTNTHAHMNLQEVSECPMACAQRQQGQTYGSRGLHIPLSTPGRPTSEAVDANVHLSSASRARDRKASGRALGAPVVVHKQTICRGRGGEEARRRKRPGDGTSRCVDVTEGKGEGEGGGLLGHSRKRE